MSDYDFHPTVHDHFEGSFNCVECGGRCKLTGSDLAYTALTRAIFEGEAFSGGTQRLPYLAEQQMIRAGVPVGKFRQRAKNSKPLSKC